MKNSIKSLKKYIEQLINGFEYIDFSPPISLNKLASKFKKILFVENAYWKEKQPEDTWDNWIFIQFKTPVQKQPNPMLGLKFYDDKIKFALIKNFDSLASHNYICQTNILIFNIWLDHNILLETLYEYMLKGIIASNNK